VNLFGLLFALARIASAAWVGAALLFVLVSIDQTKFIKGPKQEAGAVSKTAGETAPASTQPVPASPTNLLQAIQPREGDSVVLMRDLRASKQNRGRLNAELALLRFSYYYWTGATLLAVSWGSTVFLRRRYLKFSRWALVMILLTAGAGLMAYDLKTVYLPLSQLMHDAVYPPADRDEQVDVLESPQFEQAHRESMYMNGAQVALVFLASLCLCLPGTRPEAPTIIVQSGKP
jgi:hypothetical protein